MEQSTNLSGFPTHLQAQLQEAAQQVSNSHRGRGRGHERGRGRGFGHNHPHQWRGRGYSTNAAQMNLSLPPPGLTETFPPLGTAMSPGTGLSLDESVNQASQTTGLNSGGQAQGSPREFFERARGGQRGRNMHYGFRQFDISRGGHHHRGQYGTPPRTGGEEFRGRGGRRGNLYNPSNQSHMGTPDQQRAMRHRIMAQSDYLNMVHARARASYELGRAEKEMKEAFRKELENFVQSALAAEIEFTEPTKIKLKCYGSLANGFGLKGCDLDLLLAIPEDVTTKEVAKLSQAKTDADMIEPSMSKSVTLEQQLRTAIETTIPNHGTDEATAKDEPEPVDDVSRFNIQCGRIIEMAMLNHGYGARLLTNTRVPILRVCQSPSDELLKNLRQYRRKQDELLEKEKSTSRKEKKIPETPPLADLPPELNHTETEQILREFTDPEVDVTTIPLPPSPPRENASLEYSGDCGIQCDINFSNFVALHNTRLLRAYNKYDNRVGPIGVFVKAWAKVRDINTPYRGTLSSYGYILLVLHYLMNVASPPVIPNLQDLARQDDDWKQNFQVELFEGFDVRFLSKDETIAGIKESLPRNHESIGQLLRGFFWYYADHAGFHWNNDVLSIRTRGGLISKRSKGWTEAKWSGPAQSRNVRLRYLLAIEDPFEIDHNVARTVGHNGIVAIRDEFRRAWGLISKIDIVGETIAVEDFLERVENRGDMLKRDQDFHRQKMRQMRQDLEAKERALRNGDGDANSSVKDTGTLSGNDLSRNLNSDSSFLPPKVSNSQLTKSQTQKASRRHKTCRRKLLRVLKEDDNDDGDMLTSKDNPSKGCMKWKQMNQKKGLLDQVDSSARESRDIISIPAIQKSVGPTEVDKNILRHRRMQHFATQKADSPNRLESSQSQCDEHALMKNFHFNARQLRDLALIDEGGNGCARAPDVRHPIFNPTRSNRNKGQPRDVLLIQM